MLAKPKTRFVRQLHQLYKLELIGFVYQKSIPNEV